MKKNLFSLITFMLITVTACSNLALDSSANGETVSVGSQSGSPVGGAYGTATYAVTLAKVPAGTAGTFTWYTSADGKTTTSTPTGITPSVTAVANNTATISIQADNSSVGGTYYFTLKEDTATSGIVTLTIKPSTSPSISIGTQSGTLSAGVAGTTTFPVTTANIADGTKCSVVWYLTYTDENKSWPASIPMGVSATLSNVSGNSATLTITTTVSSVVGTYYFFISGGSTESNAATLTIDKSSSNVYVAGTSCDNITAVSVAGYWLNGVWTALGNSYNSSWASLVTGLSVSGSNVYAGGICYTNASGSAIKGGYWHNGQWQELDVPNSSTTRVNAFAVSGSNIYAAGNSINRSNVIIGGCWINGSWTELPNTHDSTGERLADAITISGTTVYIGGTCLGTPTSGSVYPVYSGYWTTVMGSSTPTWTWTDLANHYSDGKNSSVYSIAVSGSTVYVAGDCMDTSSNHFAGYWTVTGSSTPTWTELQNNYSSTKEAGVAALFVSGTDVYAAGYCYNSSSVEVAGYWLNGKWHELGNSYSNTKSSRVSAITLSNNIVYISGTCVFTNNYEVAGYWENGTWVALQNSYVYSLIGFPGSATDASEIVVNP